MDGERLAAARKGVDAAVREFVSAWHEQVTEQQGDVYVVGWAASCEYIDPAMVQQDQSANCIVVPDDQHASTSRGLFSFGSDRFHR